MKIILDKEKCIGCGSCAAVCARYFELKDDGLASLKTGIADEKKEVLEIEMVDCAEKAAAVCPIQAIVLA